MDEKVILKEPDSSKLVIIGAILAIMLAIYFIYSAAKFTTLKERSLVKGSVVMKIINHNVKSVCPRCGAKGIPLCPACSVAMYWNGYSGSFICSACGKGGFPRCPRCSEFMAWIESQ